MEGKGEITFRFELKLQRALVMPCPKMYKNVGPVLSMLRLRYLLNILVVASNRYRLYELIFTFTINMSTKVHSIQIKMLSYQQNWE